MMRPHSTGRPTRAEFFAAGIVLLWVLFFVWHPSILIPLGGTALLGFLLAAAMFSLGAQRLSLLAVTVAGLATVLFAGEVAGRYLHAPGVRDDWSRPLRERDPELGTILVANAAVRHRRYPQALGFQLEWDVEYHTNANRDRRVPNAPADGPVLAVFGDSFMFGEGLDDQSTIPGQLQALLPTVRVVNYAVSGHGTGQNYLYLTRVMGRSPETRGCLLGFITDHVRRTSVPYSMMMFWGREHPRVRVRDGKIVNLGRAYDTLSLPSRLHADLIGASIIYGRMFGGWSPRPDDWDLTGTLVLAMRDQCESAGSGRRFTVVVLPARINGPDPLRLTAEYERWFAKLLERGVHAIDLEEKFDAEVRASGTPRAEFFFKDGHPTLRYAKLVAGMIATELRPGPGSR